MRIEGKIWGTTAEIFKENGCSVHLLDIKAGGFCSEHNHQAKRNYFFVLSGTLEVTIYRNGLIDTVTLTSGNSTAVEPGLFHKFTAKNRCRALEFYNAILSESDIKRRTHGGIKGNAASSIHKR